MEEIIKSSDIPQWPRNDVGSAYVPHMGNVKMKPIDYKKMLPHVIQTPLWLGTSCPSYESLKSSAELKSKENSANRSHGNKGKEKSKAKGKDKGEDKREDKGKDKGK